MIDAAYRDKLEGKISKKFWKEQHSSLFTERMAILSNINGYHTASQDFYETAELVLAFSRNVLDIFKTKSPETKRRLFNLVLLNCTLTSAKSHYCYKKPFDVGSLVKDTDRTDETRYWIAIRINNHYARIVCSCRDAAYRGTGQGPVRETPVGRLSPRMDYAENQT
jgi:hypothetical protein